MLYLLTDDPDLHEYAAQGLAALEALLACHAGFHAYLEARGGG